MGRWHIEDCLVEDKQDLHTAEVLDSKGNHCCTGLVEDHTDPEVGPTGLAAVLRIHLVVDHTGLEADHCNELVADRTVLEVGRIAVGRYIDLAADHSIEVVEGHIGCEVGHCIVAAVGTGFVKDRTDPAVDMGLVEVRIDCCRKKVGAVVQAHCHKEQRTVEEDHNSGSVEVVCYYCKWEFRDWSTER